MRLVEGDQSAHLRRMLQPGEQLLWEGRPAPGVHLQPGDGFMIPFSVIWCGFAVFWEASAIRERNAAGACTVGRALYSGWAVHGDWPLFPRGLETRKRTYYGVTNKRVILMEHRGTKFVTYRQIPTLEKHVKSNGEGTVYLSEPRGYYSRGSYRRDDQNRTALVNIPDAERVYWLIEANMLQESQE